MVSVHIGRHAVATGAVTGMSGRRVRHVCQSQKRRWVVDARACASLASKKNTVKSKFTLHAGETTLSFPIESQIITGLSSSIDSILEVFRMKETEKRPKRYDSLHFRYEPPPQSIKRTNKDENIEITLSADTTREELDTSASGADDNLQKSGVSLEVFCNPNMHSSAFNAIALVTINMMTANGEEMRFVTECGLSALKSDVEEFLKN